MYPYFRSAVQVCFNSLLEMRSHLRLDVLPVAINDLFQFSIGDALMAVPWGMAVGLCEFQFSIGDAEPLQRKA